MLKLKQSCTFCAFFAFFATLHVSLFPGLGDQWAERALFFANGCRPIQAIFPAGSADHALRVFWNLVAIRFRHQVIFALCIHICAADIGCQQFILADATMMDQIIMNLGTNAALSFMT